MPSIPGLPAASSVAGANEIIVSQSGTTRRATVTQLATAITGSGGAGFLVLDEGDPVPGGTPDGTLIFRRAAGSGGGGGGAVTLVRSNQGSTGATAAASVNASLGGAATAGDVLLMFVASDNTVATPSGWTLDKSQVNSNAHYLFRKVAAGGENVITLTPAAAASVAWWVGQYDGLATTAPLATASAGDSSTPTSRSTGTTSTTSGATDGLAIASMGYSTSAGGTAITTNAWSNSFTEVGGADVCTTSATSGNAGLAVATRTPTADGAFETTGTLSNGARGTGIVAIYAAA